MNHFKKDLGHFRLEISAIQVSCKVKLVKIMMILFYIYKKSVIIIHHTAIQSY